jgi:hypothetical protein
LTCVTLAGCTTMPGSWLDQTALVMQPSHHEIVMAYSFGGGRPVVSSEPHRVLTVAEAISDADRPYRGPMEELQSIDYRSGLLYLRVPRRADSRSYTLFKNPMTCSENAPGASICRK